MSEPRVLTLYRMKENEVCTLGRLEAHDAQQICVTLEEPWRDNQPDVSRIPAGEYEAFKRLSPARGYVVPELRDVPGRTNVQMHKGNTVADTLGCILVGSGFGENAITGSRLAFEKLMTELKDVETFRLKVVDIQEGA